MNTLKAILLLTVLTLLLIFIGQLIAGPVGALVAFVIALLMNLVSFWCYYNHSLLGKMDSFFRGRG